MNTWIHIPTNFTGAGKLLGAFEPRNALEAAVFGVPTTALLLCCLPFGLTKNIILCAVIVVPVCGFALSGIRDYSLMTFMQIYIQFRRMRRIITYRGYTWENKTRRK